MSPHAGAASTSSWLGLGLLLVATLLQSRTPEPASRESELAREVGCPRRGSPSYDPFGRAGRELDAEINALMDRLIAATTREERESIKRKFDAARQRRESLRSRASLEMSRCRTYRCPISEECRRNPLQKACM